MNEDNLLYSFKIFIGLIIIFSLSDSLFDFEYNGIFSFRISDDSEFLIAKFDTGRKVTFVYDFFQLVNGIEFSLCLTISVITDITFIGNESTGEVGRSWVLVITFDGFTHVSNFQHLFPPRVDDWLSRINQFLGHSIGEYDQALFQSNDVLVMN